MSEKKTTSKKVHTLTLEDQTKLAQANVKNIVVFFRIGGIER